MAGRDLQFAQNILDSVNIIGKTIAVMRGHALSIEEAEALDKQLDGIFKRFVIGGFDPDAVDEDNVTALRTMASEIRERYTGLRQRLEMCSARVQ